MSDHSARGPRWTIPAACAVVVASGLAVIADQAPQDQPRPTFRTEANYVRVDVYATMRDGTPVTDLRRDEFELFEDRARQTIDQFTPVVIRNGGTASTRSDPRTPEESRQAITEPFARVFVLFLDVMHVDGTASQTIARPLIDTLRRLIGPDDLIAIVTPQTPGRTVTFTRQLANVETTLNRAWGLRDRKDLLDAEERKYAACYPGLPPPDQKVAPDLGIAQEMILRRREEQTFDALEELVTYLRDVREERKAVIAITNGWRVYAPNQTLTRAIGTTLPSTPQAGFDPVTGKLSTGTVRGQVSTGECDADRLRLANLDHTWRLRRILDLANRANVSFYPVDPRGIVVFDDDIVPVAGVGQNPAIGVVEDNRRLGERHTSLRTMAEGTDGVAVIETNNFDPALRRMISDLSSYYLVGYYSTGKLDGSFHAINVRVTRPGVQIRARRGYLAASTTSPSPTVETPASAAAAAETRAVTAALASLGAIGREPSLHLQAAVAAPAAGTRTVWTIVEVARGTTANADWATGGEADVMLIDSTGNTAGSAHATLPPGAGSARVTIAPRTLAPGNYELRVRAKGGGAAAASNDSIRLSIPPSDGSGAMFFRRGPTTANKEVATADLRFRRSDTLRVAVPATPTASPEGARLLDRTGKALAVPTSVSPVDDADGSRWLSAQATLAPLAPGDYLIEITTMEAGTQKRTLTAFRVVP
jgi:VWFA-related protein